MRGRLIVLEGGEATGKRIRALLLDPDLPTLDARTETLLLLAARAQHVAEVIAPALASGRDVVCDRFAGSTLAYQGWGRGLDPAVLADLSRWAAAGTEPDVVILLRVPAGVAEERLGRRGTADRMEGEDSAFFGRVAAGYDTLAAADPARWLVVDGSGTVEEVAAVVDASLAGSPAQSPGA